MSGYACGTCDTIGPLFTGDAGSRLSAAFDIPLLARIPFAPRGGGMTWLPGAVIDAVLRDRSDA